MQSAVSQPGIVFIELIVLFLYDFSVEILCIGRKVVPLQPLFKELNI